MFGNQRFGSLPTGIQVNNWVIDIVGVIGYMISIKFILFEYIYLQFKYISCDTSCSSLLFAASVCPIFLKPIIQCEREFI